LPLVIAHAVHEDYFMSIREALSPRLESAPADTAGGVTPTQERPIHRKARQEQPPLYPARFPVPDDKVSWDVEFPDYKPPYSVAPVVLENDKKKNPNGWADPEDIAVVQRERVFHSYEGVVKFDAQGRPKNPRGRTGIEGRGLLGKWGANFAADPIVTRINPHTKQIEMLAIQRNDNGQWAIPGGMVDEGETVPATLKREFREEAGMELDMDDAVEVYRGYVDDPRNTDNAWVETTAVHNICRQSRRQK